MKRLVIAVALVAVLARGVAACSCLPTPFRPMFDRSTAVFRGWVIASTYFGPSGSHSMGRTVVVLRVTEAWKGVRSDALVSINAGGSGSMCGYSFVRGHEYLVYADPCGSGRVELCTNSCTRTTGVAGASADLDSLGLMAKVSRGR